ncbi:hypothetical protein BSKO_12473 [Bryopsis sp. KO-2023]|nr:hypothetical protein BSKO_12473 [Bryopsis sp. KO-2023]
MGRLPLEEHDGIAYLQRVFGGGPRDGLFGTDVIVTPVSSNYRLKTLAIDAFRRYLGRYWSMYGAEFLANWRESVAVPPVLALCRKPLVQLLRECEDVNLESSCEMLTETWDDPLAARQALEGVFNGSDVDELSVFSLDDGGIYYGMVVAAHVKTGKSGKFVGLVTVFDDQGY